jgi:hypothetical protein
MFNRIMRQKQEEIQMDQVDAAAAPTTALATTEPQAKPPAAGKQRSPQAALGLSSEMVAARLAEQAATTQRLPANGAKAYLELGASAVAALGELAPGNAVEALLATQMVAAHNVALDLLRMAAGDIGEGRVVEERTRQYARVSEMFLRHLDRFVRERGRQRQAIRIEHVRMVDDGRVTVRQEEERAR